MGKKYTNHNLMKSDTKVFSEKVHLQWKGIQNVVKSDSLRNFGTQKV